MGEGEHQIDDNSRPTHTQTPNAFYDSILPEIETLSELKVTLAIIRQTVGWHRDEDELSLSQLQALTGLSRQGVLDGIEAGVKRGTIQRRPKGQGYVYSILVNGLDQLEDESGQQIRPALVNGLDQLEDESGQQIRPAPVNGLDQLEGESGQQIRPVLVNGVDTQKKKKESKEESTNPESDHQRTMRLYDEELKKINPRNSIKDGGASGKAVKNMLARGYTPEQIIWVWRELKARPFFERQYLSMVTVDKQIDDMLRGGLQGGSDNGGHGTHQSRRVSRELGEQIRAAHRKT